MLNILDQDIKFITGVGPKRAEILNKELEIFTAENMLRHYPYRYVDRSKFYTIREINSENAYVQIKGQITSFTKTGVGRKQRLIAIFSDGQNTIELIWFQGVKYILEKHKTGVDYVLFGKPSVFNGRYNFSHPELELLKNFSQKKNLGLQPFYHTTERMKKGYLGTKAIQKICYEVLKIVWNNPLQETLPAEILKKHHLITLTDALINIHFPKNMEMLNKAKFRLKLTL